nr:cytochrome b [Neoseiulus californicus]WKV28867.2 cytochrome b [Neoseiulus californicus]
MMYLKKYSFSPMPSNIYYWWNFGSLLGFCLILQILSGLFLSFYYENNIENSFNSISQIERNINLGWLIRALHANGASFFIFIYLHIGRGLYFKSFNLKYVWLTGVIILLMLFITAFLGYVLPWGQMSFWGATVITNLLSSIPYTGNMLTIWLWGNFSVSKATLMRFFSFHFILPLLMMVMIFTHILFLHSKGSNNPLGVNSNLDKLPFHPFFSWKDILGVVFIMNFFMAIALISPYSLMDPDNFIPANPLVTPAHIQPEWYFLFAYAILRTIPNKLGGVIALISSILILIILPFIYKDKSLNKNNLIIFKLIFFTWVLNFMYLTMMGAMPIEAPYENISKISSFIYFFFYFTYI